MRVTTTVRTAKFGDRRAVEYACEATLAVGVRGSFDGVDSRVGVPEQIVDVPVTGLPVAGGELLVALDPLEATGAASTPDVGVPPRVEANVAERANPDCGLLS